MRYSCSRRIAQRSASNQKWEFENLKNGVLPSYLISGYTVNMLYRTFLLDVVENCSNSLLFDNIEQSPYRRSPSPTISHIRQWVTSHPRPMIV
jgi:hypothetical protein